MTKLDRFDLQDFLPYLLNQAAEDASAGFQAFYKERYGMLRTEWRVLFHLGRYGEMTAKEICERARLHKTKVSRAVASLGKRRIVSRRTLENDRRQEMLYLTKQGEIMFKELLNAAQRYDAELATSFSAEEGAVLRRCLKRLAGL